jgi:hypothetical protein
VAVVGTTAVVSAVPAACAPSAATVVDLREPARPRVVAQLPVPDGLAVAALAALHVTTTPFTGDLLAVAVRGCRPDATGAGIRFYDVTDPASPRPLGRSDGADPQSVSLALRPDGRVVVAAVVATPGAGGGGLAVELDDASDPARPGALARWTRPVSDVAACPVQTGDARLAEGGQRAVVAFDDGRVYDLGLDDPAQPATRGSALGDAGGGRDPHAASVPVGRRTLAVVTQGQGRQDDCTGVPPDRAVRMLALQPPAPVSELATVRYPGTAAPGRIVASGEQAFVAWHADGLRVLDLGAVTPGTVARFVPPDPDVVGVGVLATSVVVTDSRSGLYVLDRPEEGRRESLWSKIKGAAGFMSIPLLLGAIWAVPRLAMGTAPSASRSRVPVPAARRRRQ